MGSAELPARVPSCTACEWDLSAEPIPSPVEDGAFMVRFLRDQQDVLFWYLYLGAAGTSAGGSFVVCSPIPFDATDMTGRREQVLANTWWCAPEFEQFVYRFWIENVLWFSLNEFGSGVPDPSGAGTDERARRAYLAHYAGTAD